MKLLDRFRHASAPVPQRPDPFAIRLKAALKHDWVLNILREPSAYNRATRRSVGLRGSPTTRQRVPMAERPHDCRLGQRAARRQRRLQKEAA